MTFDSDEKLFEFCRTQLYSAVVSDILDSLGYREQALREDIRPLHPDHVVVGRARTVLWMEVFHIPENPYELEIQAIDSLKPGDVMVHATGGSRRIVPWGELMTTAAVKRRATGAVIDGLTRDVKQILTMDFPVFCVGMKPLDSKGRGMVMDVDCSLECGGVPVNPGDIIFGDYDGLVVVPQEIEAEVWAQAAEKVEGENVTREELLQGALLSEVYAKYGVL